MCDKWFVCRRRNASGMMERAVLPDNARQHRNDILIQIRRRAALDAMYAACRKTAYRVVLKKDMEQMKAYTQRGGFAGGCHLLGRGIGYGVDLR